MINRRRGAPLYELIAAELRDQIRSGAIGPGQPLPSERYLTQQYGVSRDTAHRAHGLLRAEGLVDAPRGQALVVREVPAMRELIPPAGATVTARASTLDERDELGLADGVPLLVVTGPDGDVQVFPADRWQLRWPGGS